MPFDVPPLAIPAPSVPVSRIPELDFFASRQSGISCTTPSVLGVCGGVFYIGYFPRTALGLIELFGSEDRYRTALEATRVTVVHIRPRTHNIAAPEDYKEYDSLVLDEIESNIWRQAITADETYNWAPTPAEFDSFPVYDLRIRLFRGEKVLTADLSRSARTFRVIENYAIIAEQPLSAYGYALLEILTESAERRE